MIKLLDILNEILEEKDDRCLRIARRKFDKPSAYRSGAIVRCRKGKIWKGLKEENELNELGEKDYRYEEILDIFDKSSNKKDILNIINNYKQFDDDKDVTDGDELKQYLRRLEPKEASKVYDALSKYLNLSEAKKETLRTWFKRKGAPGKTGGWVDCNTCREVDGKTKCKPCGRQKGEKRAKYPSCRPTPSQCKQPGKGKKWGKTK